MNKNQEVIYLAIQNYKEILRHTCPSDYYYQQCDQMDDALEWLDKELDRLYRLETGDPKKLGGF